MGLGGSCGGWGELLHVSHGGPVHLCLLSGENDKAIGATWPFPGEISPRNRPLPELWGTCSAYAVRQAGRGVVRPGGTGADGRGDRACPHEQSGTCVHKPRSETRGDGEDEGAPDAARRPKGSPGGGAGSREGSGRCRGPGRTGGFARPAHEAGPFLMPRLALCCPLLPQPVPVTPSRPGPWLMLFPADKTVVFPPSCRLAAPGSGPPCPRWPLISVRDAPGASPGKARVWSMPALQRAALCPRGLAAQMSQND